MLDTLNNEGQINTDLLITPIPTFRETLLRTLLGKDLTPEDWERIKEILEEEHDPFEFATMASALKIIHPETRLKTRWAQIKEILKIYQNDWAGNEFLDLLPSIKILNPNFNTQIPENGWKLIMEKLSVYQEKGSLYDFAMLAAGIRILNPGINLEINPEQLEKIKEALRKDLDACELYEFVYRASRLLILTAKEVSFDNQGVHLVIEKRGGVQEEIPERPRVF